MEREISKADQARLSENESHRWFGAALWASAFVLCGLILSSAGHRAGNAALAEMAVDGSEYALVTTKGGNEEVLYVLEKRTGRIFVYEASPNRAMSLLDFQDVGQWIDELTKNSRP